MPNGHKSVCVLLLTSVCTLGAAGQPTVYWSNTYTGSLQRTVIGSTTVEELIEGFVDRPQDLTLDVTAGKLYWTLAVQSPAPNNVILQRSNLDGSALENLVFSGYCSPFCPVSAMTLDHRDGSLYWFTWDDLFPASHFHFRADTDGSAVDTVGSSDNVVLDVVIDVTTNQLYWIEGKWPGHLADHAIRRSALDGSGSEELLLVFDGSPPTDAHVAVDLTGGQVYWATDNRAIRRANLDGSEIEDLVLPDGDPDSTTFGDIAIDAAAGKLYWSATYGGTNAFPVGAIHRSNLDGTDVEVLVSLEQASIGAFALDLGGSVSRDADPSLPPNVSMGPAYPNPARARARIPFTLSEPAFVTIELFDLLGRRVKLALAGFSPAGPQEAALSTDDLSAGVYIYRLRTGGVVKTGRITVVN